jgi:hypothetical protein
MPKFGIHYIVLKKLREKLEADSAAEHQELARILNENGSQPASAASDPICCSGRRITTWSNACAIS